MLRIMRTVGTTLVVMLALGGVASGHNFNSSVTGNLKVVKNATQIFKTGTNTEVKCTKDSVVTGTASKGLQLSVLAQVEYTGCTVERFGFKFEATVSLAQYVFSADNELVNLENTIVIKVPIASCNITVKPQDLKKVLYTNTAKHILITPEVSGILSTGSGGECGGHSSTGTYEGSTEVEVVGGEISWS
jgi:hypothetical protein